jgi:hypothetical protein
MEHRLQLCAQPKASKSSHRDGTSETSRQRGSRLGNVGRVGSCLPIPTRGAHKKADRCAPLSRELDSVEQGVSARSCSSKTKQEGVGRREPAWSPGVGPGHQHFVHADMGLLGGYGCQLREGSATTPTPCAALSPHTPANRTHTNLCLARPYPHLSACLSRFRFGVYGPVGVPLAVAVAAQPRPGAPGRRKS